jgi:creatinine amidohydrolase/Fe(II)-dependent formamide hydrolase-like protein
LQASPEKGQRLIDKSVEALIADVAEFTAEEQPA